jgi:hypothetical protein
MLCHLLLPPGDDTRRTKIPARPGQALALDKLKKRARVLPRARFFNGSTVRVAVRLDP